MLPLIGRTAVNPLFYERDIPAASAGVITIIACKIIASMAIDNIMLKKHFLEFFRNILIMLPFRL
jgi:hypothetical protein